MQERSPAPLYSTTRLGLACELYQCILKIFHIIHKNIISTALGGRSSYMIQRFLASTKRDPAFIAKGTMSVFFSVRMLVLLLLDMYYCLLVLLMLDVLLFHCISQL